MYNTFQAAAYHAILACEQHDNDKPVQISIKRNGDFYKVTITFFDQVWESVGPCSPLYEDTHNEKHWTKLV